MTKIFFETDDDYAAGCGAFDVPAPALTTAVATATLAAAFAAPYTVKPVYGGCARIYVDLSLPGHASKVAVAKAAKALGLVYGPNYYSKCKTSIYIGYDNATGREYAKGVAVAAALAAAGWSASADGYGD